MWGVTLLVVPSLLLPQLAPRSGSMRTPVTMAEKLDFMKLLDGEKLTPKPAAPVAAPPAPAPAPEAAATPVTVKVKPPEPVGPLKPFAPDGAPAGYEALADLLDPPVAAPADEPSAEAAAPADGLSADETIDVADAAEAEEAEEAADEPIVDEVDKLLSCTPSGWGGDCLAKIEALEEGFDKTQDAAALREQLLGSWKLLVDDSEVRRGAGLAGQAEKPWTTVVGQFQTFRKPDPLDILNGNLAKAPLLETTEVVADTRVGTTVTAALKGGYQISKLTSANGLPGVVEYYTSRQVGGSSDELELAPNRWSCSYVSPTLRVCKQEDGSKARRVYAKVEPAAAQDDIARLGKLEVGVDKAAVAAYKAEEEAKAKAKAKAASDEDEDDPNDDRPMWQKRIDKADGIKRTKNGTPIINHGPPTA